MPGPDIKLLAATDHIHAGRLEQARILLARILQHAPDSVDANSMMCFVLIHQGQADSALYYARRADQLAPSDPNLLNNLGNALMLTGDFDAAADAYGRAHALDRSHVSSLIGLTNALNCRHRYAESEGHCRQALGVHPGNARLMGQLAIPMLQTGRAREAVSVLQDACALAPDDLNLATGLCQALNYAGDQDPAAVHAAHTRYGDVVARAYPGRHLPPDLIRNPERRVRVGILSADLRNHAVGFFAESWLASHDRDGFEITCYSTATAHDGVSARLKAHVAAWREVSHLKIPELAALIRRDRTDILLDLSGHTAGHRLPVMHLRPALVHVSYFGYPNTTGIRGCDWRIVDSWTDPPEPSYDQLASERLWRLDPCFLCYTPPRDAPPVSPTPSSGGAPVTFGSFNALAKLDDIAVDLFTRVVSATPRSRLLMKYHGLGDPGVRELTARRFATAGLDPARLILDPPGKSAAEVLPAYSRVDIMLDSFPYHGTTTTCEAMLMGVPIVTLVGNACAARVGLSLVSNLGHPEWAAQTPEQYIEIATRLAGDPPTLASMRQGLRETFLRSPMCDAAGFSRRLESALREMWRAAVAGPRI